ncbi:MAG: hypothetical protein U0637_03515 [Phycisphaerales bacterium]
MTPLSTTLPPLLAAAPAGTRTLTDRLFGLHDLSTGGAGVQFQFARDWPLWAWALTVVLCGAIAVWSYLRIAGPRPARMLFASLRTLTLVLIAVLIAGPQLVRQNERVEKDWVVLLADRSRSMQVVDAPGPDGGPRTTREEQLKAALAAASPALATLRKDRELLTLGFDQGTFDLPGAPASAPDLGAPQGARTALGTALQQSLQRTAGRPASGIVILSDGRSFDQPSRATLQELADRNVPVFVYPLGSPAPLADVAITRIDAPPASFVGDLVPVTVDIDRLGASGQSRPTGGTLRLISTDGTVLDEKEVPEAPAGQSRVTLSTRAEGTGRKDWRVEFTPSATSEDLTPDNNAQRVTLELVDRPIRLVYFDGYPRWEYRYLKNLILREKSFRSTNMLLASNRRSIQEGTDRLETLPRSAQEWSTFDVIIMGDLRPAVFTREQMESIRTQVSERGAGLLMIGGPSFTPGAWTGTPLGELLPFSVPTGEAGGTLPTFHENVLLAPGPAARQYGVLQLGESSDQPWPEALTNPDLKWNAFRWAQRIDPASLKPSAETIALAAPAGGEGTPQPGTPLVVTMRYGAGRIVYVATDETWRYRYGRGETLTERFWIPVLRLLARGSLGRSGQAALLTASPDQANVQQPVRVTVKLLDQALIQRAAASIAVRITPAGAGQQAPESVTLSPERTGDASSVATYAGTWVPAQPGAYTVTSDDPLLTGQDLAARVEITLPEDELRRPQADHEALASLAMATGGRVLTPQDLPNLAALLPNRELRILGTPDIETLWDKPIALALLLTLLAAEWIGRRLIKLA